MDGHEWGAAVSHGHGPAFQEVTETSQEIAKNHHLWSQETRVPDLVQLLSLSRSSCWPFPSRNHKGTSHLNYPQLDSSLCPQRSVTLSGNSTSTPSSPSQTPGSHQRCIYLTLTTPHIQSITTAQSLHLTAAPGQSSPSSDATVTSSLSQIVQQLCQTLKSILCTN